MNLISFYSNSTSNYSLQNKLQLNENIFTSLSQRNNSTGSIQGLVQRLSQKFQNCGLVFLSPVVLPNNTLVAPNNYDGSYEKVSFCIVHDAMILQYQYSFQVEINFCTNVFKIIATILQQGRIINVYKQGLVHLLSTNFLCNNTRMNTFSLRIHPITGIVKFAYINHMSSQQILEFIKLPTEFSDVIKQNVKKMVSYLDERFLGKILHYTNKIPLKDITPQNIDQDLQKIQPIHPLFPKLTLPPLQSLTKKLKDLKKYITNSTIKHNYLHKDNQNQIIRYRRQFQRRNNHQRDQKMTKHNFKISSFSTQVKNILRYFTSINGLMEEQLLYGCGNEHAMLELTEQEIHKLRQVLKCQPNPVNGTPIKSTLTIQKIENQTNLCAGGFANISVVVAKQAVRRPPIQNPQNTRATNQRSNKITIVRKSSTIQKLFWEKLVINHISQGSCMFITKYFDLKLQPNPPNNFSMIENSAKSLNDNNALTNQPNFSNLSQSANYPSTRSNINIPNGSFMSNNNIPHSSQMSNNTNYNQKLLDDSIFMQYFPDKSLNNFLSRMSFFMSIKSKIFLIYQCTIGLRYLRDYGIVHLDIKPDNLLVRIATIKNANAFTIVKITDFGEAYGDTLIGNRKRGHTCPYAPPQLVNAQRCQLPEVYQAKYNQKSDVFSLGVMILIMIFQLSYVDIKRLNSLYVLQSPERQAKFYSLCLEKCRYIYYQPLIQVLMEVAYKCISHSHSLRPYLNWFFIILDCIYHAIEDIQKC